MGDLKYYITFKCMHRKAFKNMGFPVSSHGKKKSVCNAGDVGSTPGSGRSPGEGNGNPLQYSCLENPMDRGAWRATVPGVTKSWTQLSDRAHTHTRNQEKYWWTYLQGRNRDTEVKNGHVGISLVVQQLRLHTPSAEGLGSVSGQGTNLTCLELKAGATK